jgi:hypothetical protein
MAQGPPRKPAGLMWLAPLLCAQTQPVELRAHAELPFRFVVYGDARFTDPTNSNAASPPVRRALVQAIADADPPSYRLVATSLITETTQTTGKSGTAKFRSGGDATSRCSRRSKTITFMATGQLPWRIISNASPRLRTIAITRSALPMHWCWCWIARLMRLQVRKATGWRKSSITFLRICEHAYGPSVPPVPLSEQVLRMTCRMSAAENSVGRSGIGRVMKYEEDEIRFLRQSLYI